MNPVEELKAKYADLFGSAPEFVVRAPGRVNLIGEHTDYNDGFVFPAAINYDIVMAGGPRNDRQVRAYSVTFDQATTFLLDDLKTSEQAAWSNYVQGVAAILKDEGHALRGINLAISGTVPISSGLSSSAAMEVASCLAFESASGFQVDPVRRALIGQRAEREFVGVQCGIMDQFISANGRADRALFLDTRSLDYEAVPLPGEGVTLVVGDTNKRRGLVASEYNQRRAECEQAVVILKVFLPGIKALRDVSETDFTKFEERLPETVRKRARHVVTENERVLQSVRALKSGEIEEFGRLMDASHVSLRDDFQVSCRELDVMVEAAQSVPGVYGARMTGAGFGGCTVSLVKTEAVTEFERTVGAKYAEGTGLKATFYICRASDGARRVE
jgi:galactokinase